MIRVELHGFFPTSLCLLGHGHEPENTHLTHHGQVSEPVSMMCVRVIWVLFDQAFCGPQSFFGATRSHLKFYQVHERVFVVVGSQVIQNRYRFLNVVLCISCKRLVQ